MRTPLAVCAALISVLLGAAAAFQKDGDDGGAATPRGKPMTPLPELVRRVEKLRGLRFEHVPVPRQVTAKQARREGLADFDRTYPVAERRADETVLQLLGLLERGDDLRDVAGSIFGGEVAGYYDPHAKELSIVEDARGTGGRVVGEITLAHELTHALEDDAIGIDDEQLEGGSDDAQLAYQALVEGTATALMFEYADRHFKPGEALGGLIAPSFSGAGTALPPFIEAQLIFPYFGGKTFVEKLYARGEDTWTLPDLALKTRPPASTEQILHPEKWIAVEPPEPVRLPRPPKPWKRVDANTMGEWATSEWLSSDAAGAGWGGDRYELWQDEEDCPPPCEEHSVLVMRWRWDTAKDAREFLASARLKVGELAREKTVGIAATGPREATIVFAPEQRLVDDLLG